MPRRRRARPALNAENENQALQAPRTDTDKLVEAVRLTASSLAAIAVRVGPLRTEKIDAKRMYALSLLGFKRDEIAGILGTTPDTVRVRLSEGRVRGRARRRRRAAR